MKASASLVDLKKVLFLSFANKAAFQRMMFANSLNILSAYPSHAKKKTVYMRKKTLAEAITCSKKVRYSQLCLLSKVYF